MTAAPVRIVTVTRELGAGGSEFARVLGQHLGWPVLDHDIVHRVAERLRLDDDTVEHFDEHPPSLLARIAAVLVVPQPELFELLPVDTLPSHDRIARTATRCIRDAGAAPPLVVVGHGAACIFAGRTDALHVFLHGPFEARVRRIVERLGVPAAKAPAVVRRADHERQQYVQRYFHVDWRADALYDLRVGTGAVPVPELVAFVERLVRARDAGAAPVHAAP